MLRSIYHLAYNSGGGTIHHLLFGEGTNPYVLLAFQRPGSYIYHLLFGDNVNPHVLAFQRPASGCELLYTPTRDFGAALPAGALSVPVNDRHLGDTNAPSSVCVTLLGRVCRQVLR